MRYRLHSRDTTYEIVRSSEVPENGVPIRFAAPSDASALLRILARDEWNLRTLRAFFREGHPEIAVSDLAGPDLAERLGAGLASGRVRMFRIAAPSPIVTGTAGPEGGAKPAPAPASEKPKRVPLTSLKVLEVAFKTDHDKLKDNAADWKNIGARFPKPEWKTGSKPNHPISHTKEREITIEVKIETGPPSGEAQEGTLIGDGPEYLTFQKKFHVTPGVSTHKLTSRGRLPNQVVKLEKSIDWKLQLAIDGTLTGDSSGAHTIYVTYDTPREEGKQEDGATVKRMELAVDWVGATGKLKPSEIIDELFKRFPHYILGFNMLSRPLQEELERDAAMKKKLQDDGFAAYDHRDQLKKGGAWLLAENEKWGGECQAIVRCLRGILYQVGVPGKVEVLYVNADAAEPYRPRLRTWGSAPSGPNANRRYALADKYCEEGKYRDEFPQVGWNNYEAYMQFTHEGDPILYGGGIGRMPDNFNPIAVFFGLVEYELEFDTDKMAMRSKITKIWAYRDKTMRTLTPEVEKYNARSTWKIE